MLALRGSLCLASDDVNMADGSQPDGFTSYQKYSEDAYNLSLDLGVVQNLLRLQHSQDTRGAGETGPHLGLG